MFMFVDIFAALSALDVKNIATYTNLLDPES